MSMFQKLLSKAKRSFCRTSKFTLHEYKDSHGNFDYASYKRIQEEGNRRKISSSWVTREEIEFLSQYIQKEKNTAHFGICHGTRQGLEQKWFSEFLGGAVVIGTEISSTATDFPNTVQWDFHDVNAEWHDKADFIYSNSFDHSYDPEKAINSWMDSLKKDGVCIIEHSEFHEPSAVDQLDPFGANLDVMPYLILKWSQGAFSVREILVSPYKKKGSASGTRWLLIKKN